MSANDSDDRAQNTFDGPGVRDGIGYRIVDGEHHDRVYMLDEKRGDPTHDEALRLWALDALGKTRFGVFEDMKTLLASAAQIEAYIRDGATP